MTIDSESYSLFKCAENSKSSTVTVCRLCLGKVKDPIFCPNMDAFCAVCYESWHEKSPKCPVCGAFLKNKHSTSPNEDNYENVQRTKSSMDLDDFTNPNTRKSIFIDVFERYEEEISRLKREILKLKEKSNSKHIQGDLDLLEMIKMLRCKLQSTQIELDQAIKEKDQIKNKCKKLDQKNHKLTRELETLKKSSLNFDQNDIHKLGVYKPTGENENKTESSLSSCSAVVFNEPQCERLTQLKCKNENDIDLQRSSSVWPNSLSATSPLRFIKGDSQTFQTELSVSKFNDHSLDVPIVRQQIPQLSFMNFPVRPCGELASRLESEKAKIKRSPSDASSRGEHWNYRPIELPTGSYINEFMDCIELLNKAEKKVKNVKANRSPLSNTNIQRTNSSRTGRDYDSNLLFSSILFSESTDAKSYSTGFSQSTNSFKKSPSCEQNLNSNSAFDQLHKKNQALINDYFNSQQNYNESRKLPWPSRSRSVDVTAKC